MSDEDRREEHPGQGHPATDGPDGQRQGYTPVRLAGFPQPDSPPEDDAAEEEQEHGAGTGDDLCDEPAGPADTVAADDSASNDSANGSPSTEEPTGNDAASGAPRQNPAHEVSHSNAGGRSSGARLVVPASSGQTGATTPGQQEEPASEPRPASEDSTATSATAPAGSETGGHEYEQAGTDVSSSSGGTTPQPRDGAEHSASAGAPREEMPVAEASPAESANGASPTGEGADSGTGERAGRVGRSRGSAAHRQAIADSAFRSAASKGTPEEPHSHTLDAAAGELNVASTQTAPHSGRGVSSRATRSRPRRFTRIPLRALAMVAAVVVVLGAGAAGAFALWPEAGARDSGGAEQAGAQSSPGSGNGVPQAGSSAGGEGSSAVRETGVAFGELSAASDNGGSGSDEGGQDPVEVSLTASVEGGEELNWTGTAQGAVEDGSSLQESPQSARSISLSGEGSPTSANFQSGFEMPTGPGSSAEGEIQSGVMARTEPGEPVRHATYQRLAPASGDGEGGGQSVHAQGSYYIADDEGVIAEGTYTDRRQNDSQRVVRTYTEDNPATGGQRSFRVAFEAPAGTPVPTLVGWQPPREGSR